jgi:hypothetical protein
MSEAAGAPDEARMAQAPQAPAASAPPLGLRPSEPMPGKQSLADPQGKAAAAVESRSGDGGKDDGGSGGNGGDGKDDGGVCPDCGLPYRDHPDFAAGHREGHGHRHPHGPDSQQGGGPAPFNARDAPGSPAADERRLPGEELDPTGLGGDPAGT